MAVKEFPDMLTPDQLAEFLQVSRDTVDDGHKRGIFPFVQIGKNTVRFPKAAILEMWKRKPTN